MKLNPICIVILSKLHHSCWFRNMVLELISKCTHQNPRYPLLGEPSLQNGSKCRMFFIGENLSLGSGWSHVRRLWACEHGNPLIRGGMHVYISAFMTLLATPPLPPRISWNYVPGITWICFMNLRWNVV